MKGINDTKKTKYFVSVIWGYPKYFYNFTTEENYHMHALKVAENLGYNVVVIIKNEPGIIEGDPLFNKNTKIIYYSNIFSYIYLIVRYSLMGSIFYVNSVEPQSLIVPFLARRTVFYGATHPVRQNWLKQKIFNIAMRFYSKIRLDNEEGKNFLLKYGLKEDKLKVVSISMSFRDYNILEYKKERRDLVYFGNITSKKNLSTIIKACNIVSEKYPDIKLNIIGREYDQIDSKIIGKNLKIIKHGFIEKAENVNELLNDNLIYLNSSFDEGVCVSVYNAALAGCGLCLPKIMSFTGVFKDKALFHEVTDYEQLAKNIFYYLKDRQTLYKHNKLCREMIIKNNNYEKISEELEELFSFNN